MGFLKDLKFIFVLGFIVASQTHVIIRRDAASASELENSENAAEDLRAPHKYIITPWQTNATIIENSAMPLYDAVDFGKEIKEDEEAIGNNDLDERWQKNNGNKKDETIEQQPHEIDESKSDNENENLQEVKEIDSLENMKVLEDLSSMAMESHQPMGEDDDASSTDTLDATSAQMATDNVTESIKNLITNAEAFGCRTKQADLEMKTSTNQIEGLGRKYINGSTDLKVPANVSNFTSSHLDISKKSPDRNTENDAMPLSPSLSIKINQDLDETLELKQQQTIRTITEIEEISKCHNNPAQSFGLENEEPSSDALNITENLMEMAVDHLKAELKLKDNQEIDGLNFGDGIKNSILDPTIITDEKIEGSGILAGTEIDVKFADSNLEDGKGNLNLDPRIIADEYFEGSGSLAETEIDVKFADSNLEDGNGSPNLDPRIITDEYFKGSGSLAETEIDIKFADSKLKNDITSSLLDTKIIIVDENLEDSSNLPENAMEMDMEEIEETITDAGISYEVPMVIKLKVKETNDVVDFKSTETLKSSYHDSDIKLEEGISTESNGDKENLEVNAKALDNTKSNDIPYGNQNANAFKEFPITLDIATIKQSEDSEKILKIKIDFSQDNKNFNNESFVSYSQNNDEPPKVEFFGVTEISFSDEDEIAANSTENSLDSTTETDRGISTAAENKSSIENSETNAKNYIMKKITNEDAPSIFKHSEKDFKIFVKTQNGQKDDTEANNMKSKSLTKETVNTTASLNPAQDLPVYHSNAKPLNSLLSKDQIPLHTIANRTMTLKHKPNPKPDAGNLLKPLLSLLKPNRKPLSSTTSAPKPIKDILSNNFATEKPNKVNFSHFTSSPKKKTHRETTTSSPSSSHAAHKQISTTQKPFRNQPSTRKIPSTPKHGQFSWFSQFPSYKGYVVSPRPAFLRNPNSNASKKNLTGIIPVPWHWAVFNFQPNFQYLTPIRNNIKATSDQSDVAQREKNASGELMEWNGIMQKIQANTTGGLFTSIVMPQFNSSKENSRHTNATTPVSLNNSTLEVTSSAGGNQNGGGHNPSSSSSPPAPVTTSNGLNPTGGRQRQQRFVATLNCINGSSNVNNVEDENDDNDQFIVNRQQQNQQQQRHRHALCRTPPPNYHSLAVTPPPSYTPRQQIQISSELIRAGNAAAPHQHRTHLQSHPSAALRRFQVPEVLGLAIDDYHRNDNDDDDDDDVPDGDDGDNGVQLNALNVVESRQQQQQRRRSPTAQATSAQREANANAEAAVVFNAPNRQQVLVANGRPHQTTRNVATVSQQQQQQQQHQHQHQHQQQQRRRKQRRRKLHLLQQQQYQQQQQQQQHYNHYQQNLPIINVASSDSDSSTSLSDISQNTNDFATSSTTRDQRRRRRQRLLKLRDAYCPDLLNACSLILLQQQTSDSTVGSFTDTPPPEHGHDSSDYVEITEYHRNPQRLQNAQSTPEIHGHHHHEHNRLNGLDERPQTVTSRERIASEAEENQRLQNFKQEMGQNLSIRRPRISLTWVLREQHQQQQQQQQQPNEPETNGSKNEGDNRENQRVTKESKTNDTHKLTNNNQVNGKAVRNQDTNNHNSGGVEKKKYRLKQIPASSEPLNGYATTPTSYTNASTALGSQKFFSNQNLLEYHKEDACTKPPSKDLLFVCTPQRVPDGYGGSTEALALVKKRNEIRKKLAAKMAQFRSENQATRIVTNISTRLNGSAVSAKRESKSSLKSGSYSEPSLIAASEGNSRRHRHRKRRERTRPSKFGYDIKNVDEFLTKCSLATPANIPMVLSTSCILYQTRPGGYQTEISLPLGMVVNAVFKNQNWLYVQTPHAEEGYVNYTTCLPLGILPPEAGKEGKKETAKSKHCWETNGDVFPKPCGNMTDSEKEIHLRVGTRSEGARTPHLKSQLTDNETATVISAQTDNTDCINGNATSIYGEQQVDKLYLRAASQPKLTAEKSSYAQLKIIRNHSSAASAISSKSHANDEYVTLQQKSMQKHVHHIPPQKTYISRTFITNGHNGQHLHPKDMKNLQRQQQQQQSQQHHIKATANNCNNLKNPQLNNATTSITVTSYPSSPHQQQLLHHHHHPNQLHRNHHHQTLSSSTSLHHINNQSSMTAAAAVAATTNMTTTATTATAVAPRSILNAIRRSTAHCGQRQTLVAITTDYATADGLTLHKGDIVTLCECRETKDHRQWFCVRTRDGRQGYIPAEVAGHGYL